MRYSGDTAPVKQYGDRGRRMYWCKACEHHWIEMDDGVHIGCMFRDAEQPQKVNKTRRKK